MNNHKHSSFFLTNNLIDSKPYLQLLFSFFFMLISYLTITMLSLLLALPLFSINWAQLSSVLSGGLQNADINLIRYFQITQTIGLFIIPGFVLNYLLFMRDDGFVRKGEMKSSWIFFIIFCTMLFSIPMISKLIEWNNSMHLPAGLNGLETYLKQMEEERNDLTIRMLDSKKMQDLFFNLFMIAILPAIGEEFIFRGLLQQLLAKWFRNIHIAIFISAFLFSAIHLQFYGFIPRYLLGMFFGYLFFWSKNIWWAVWAHFVNNAVAVILLFMSNSGKLNIPDILKEDYLVKGGEFIISLIITSLLISLTYLMSRKVIKSSPNGSNFQ
jgi:membrane protease YdiL (CAAX protease family)